MTDLECYIKLYGALNTSYVKHYGRSWWRALGKTWAEEEAMRLFPINLMIATEYDYHWLWREVAIKILTGKLKRVKPGDEKK